MSTFRFVLEDTIDFGGPNWDSGVVVHEALQGVDRRALADGFGVQLVVQPGRDVGGRFASGGPVDFFGEVALVVVLVGGRLVAEYLREDCVPEMDLPAAVTVADLRRNRCDKKAG